MFIHFWERETEHEWERGREREGDTESEAGSRLWAVSTEPNVGLKPMNLKIMTWAKVRCLTNWATQAPLNVYFWQSTSMSWGGADREGDTECEAGSRLWAVSTSPTRGSNSQTVRSWPGPKSDAQPTEPPRRPRLFLYEEECPNLSSLPQERVCSVFHAGWVL